MRIILGIGNPGKRYFYNRHNVGFLLLDQLAGKYSLSFIPSKGDYYFCEGKIGRVEFSLIKPTTYVNNSGIAALQALENYETDISDLLVVHDDLNLEFGKIRVRVSGGDGGHNGIGSVIYHLNNDLFPRIRIGVGNDFKKGYMADYVLTDFSEKEMENMQNTFEIGLKLSEEFITGGVKQMLDANSKLKGSDSDK